MRLLGDPMNERYLFISVAVLLLGSLAALLFYVPIVPLAFAIVIVLGLALMFVFGFYLGVNQHTPPH
jgi:hypothetical protein